MLKLVMAPLKWIEPDLDVMRLACPPAHFSWVVENKIGGMKYPNDEMDILGLHSVGVGTVVTLTEEPLDFNMDQAFPNYIRQVQRGNAPKLYHIPIIDFGVPTFRQIDEFVDLARETIRKEKAIVVHCLAGIGRTGTMIACYLAAEGMSAEDAISLTRQKRPGSLVTHQQEEMVSKYLNWLKQKTSSPGAEALPSTASPFEKRDNPDSFASNFSLEQSDSACSHSKSDSESNFSESESRILNSFSPEIFSARASKSPISPSSSPQPLPKRSRNTT